MLCDARKESFEEVTVFGKTMLFTNNRIDPNTVPRGYHLYEVRHDDDMQGIPCEIGKKIIVNHWGTLISNKPIKLVKSAISNNAYRPINEEREWNYEGIFTTLNEYVEKFPLRKDRVSER